MTRIARCIECGKNVSEIWGQKDKCPDCHATLHHEDVDVPMDNVPRILNILGILAIVAVAVLFIIFTLGGGFDQTSRIVLVMIALVSGMMFISSLISQYMMQKAAWTKHEEVLSRRSTRKVRRGPSEENRMRKGSIKPAAGSAKKIPIRK